MGWRFYQKSGRLWRWCGGGGLFGLLLSGAVSGAQEALCPAVDSRAHFAPRVSDRSIELQAARVEAAGDQLQLEGAIELYSAEQQIEAESIRWQRRSGELVMEGGVRYLAEGLLVEAEKSRFNQHQHSGEFFQSRFLLPESGARGAAERLQLSPEGELALSEVSYTTCPDAASGWQLEAKTILLDPAANLGQAWNMQLQLATVPIFWFPYINFPLSGRKSGLLAPKFGNSSLRGGEVRQPLYWNIAPEQDATLTLHWLESRGTATELQWRHLGRRSMSVVEGAWLGEDRVERRSRYLWDITHRYRDPNWRVDIDWSRASDSGYLTDIGSELHSDNSVVLPQLLQAGYAAPAWEAVIDYEGYQSLNSLTHLRRLPGIRLLLQPPLASPWQLALQGELARFEDQHSRESDSRFNGSIDLQRRWWQPGYLLQPGLRVEQRDYHSSKGERSQSTTRQLSLLGKLFFERHYGSEQLATLEPTLFYLLSRESQPRQAWRLDSSPIAFDQRQLYAHHRYAGGDLSGQMHQLTLALAQRLFRSGREWLGWQLGKIAHIDPFPELSAEQWRQESYRHWLAALKWRPLAQLRLELEQQWQRDGSLAANRTTLSWRQGRRMLRAGYREQPQQALQQGYLSVGVDLGREWQLVGSWLHDLAQQRLDNGLLGLEYQHCCWRLQLLAKRCWLDAISDYDQSWQLQFELKGVGSGGDTLQNELEHGKLGATF
ncbi:LPS-assembly protein LptD [Ectothiorhodospiraceae bacterium BW-2]|nr:LPS-assembly protein LptD [Ectothiorhodospiraceae bacterium BW-2]